MMPKQDVTRTRDPNDPAAASLKPMLDEHAHRLHGHDKAGGDLQAEDTSRGHAAVGHPPEQVTPHQAAQSGADVRGEPAMVQADDPTPEGLKRERKGPYSPTRGRNEHPTQVPKNWNPREGL